MRRQEGVDVEHVVVDDGSTDDSKALLRDWPHALVLHEQPNSGLSHSLNKALELATGDIIGWLNADDFYLPGALRAVLDTFTQEPTADVVYGDSVFVDADARVIQLKPQHAMSRPVLRWYECFIAPGASFRRRSTLPVPAWNEQMRFLMDWEQDLQLQEAGARFVHMRRPVLAFRRHGQQQSALRYAGDDLELAGLVARHHLPLTGPRKPIASAAGHLLHAAMKTQAGSYRRQRRTRGLRGRDTAWWRSPEGADTAAALLAAR